MKDEFSFDVLGFFFIFSSSKNNLTVQISFFCVNPSGMLRTGQRSKKDFLISDKIDYTTSI